MAKVAAKAMSKAMKTAKAMQKAIKFKPRAIQKAKKVEIKPVRCSYCDFWLRTPSSFALHEKGNHHANRVLGVRLRLIQ